MRNQSNTASKKGLVSTKFDYSRLIWFSTLEVINIILIYTPIFGLSAMSKVCGTVVKQREIAFAAHLWE